MILFCKNYGRHNGNYRIEDLLGLQDVIYLHKINDFLDQLLLREKRMDLYKKTISFIKTRVDLDLASFKEDIWSH